MASTVRSPLLACAAATLRQRRNAPVLDTEELRMGTTPTVEGRETGTHGLQRSIGFFGLMFVSLGSIIGSGWLLGALGAAQAAGPASVLSWVLAGSMLSVLALVPAPPGAAYPVAGGTARFPYFAFGTLAGFPADWVALLQSV